MILFKDVCASTRIKVITEIDFKDNLSERRKII